MLLRHVGLVRWQHLLLLVSQLRHTLKMLHGCRVYTPALLRLQQREQTWWTR